MAYYTNNENDTSPFITVLDMWNNNQYLEIGYLIKDEEWGVARVAKFCNYMAKNAGIQSLEQLYKFL